MIRTSRSLAALFAAALTAAPAAAAEILPLPASSPFPESVTATADGTLFVSSISHGGVLKTTPDGSTPVAFVKPGDHETRSTFGVLADEKSGTLWVASNDASGLGLKGPSAVEGAWVKGFDIVSGAPRTSARLPGPPPAVANDLAVGDDGTLYVTDIAGDRIFRLKPDAKELELFLQDERLKGGLDGIAFDENGALFVTAYRSGDLYRIDMRAGAPGAITKLKTSRALKQPDGLRPFRGGFLLAEGGGAVSRVTVKGDEAIVETLGSSAGPTGVAVARERMWVAEGQLARLEDLKTGAALPSFQLRSMAAPRD